MPTNNEVANERDRLNRRIRILPKEISVKLKKNRERWGRQRAVESRGAKMIYVHYSDGGGFAEAHDLVALCHEFLDTFNVPADPSLDEPKMQYLGTPEELAERQRILSQDFSAIKPYYRGVSRQQ